MNCDACGTGTHVFVLLQRDMDDAAQLDLVGVYRSLAGAKAARAETWADADFQDLYGGAETDHFRIEQRLLGD